MSDTTPKEGESAPTFASTFARQREAQGLSQSQIARELGISQSAVSSWESGDTEPSDHRTVYAIERLLKLSPGRLTRLLWGCAPAERGRRVSTVGVQEAIEADPSLDDLAKRVLLSVYKEMRNKACDDD